MPAKHFSPLPTSLRAKAVYVLGLLICISIGGWSIHKKSHRWAPGEVPIAFWSWRTETPSADDVQKAVERLGARSLFLRAGQIAYGDGKPHRVRAVVGYLPKNIDLHLVYNGTPSLLQELDTVDDRALVNAIAIAYHEDAQRAAQQNARVAGVQLDIDVPTRLLKRYARWLSMLRADLAKGTSLSITGLPTWMDSSALKNVLDQADFWTPQFYGGEVPGRLSEIVPISRPELVEEGVRRATALGRPFYAGLAAYGAAFLYSSSGALISLQGSIDPSIVAADPNLELIGARSFSQNAKSESNYRYAFRARADGVTDRLAMHRGDVLVIEVPTAESLRIASRIVRENGGRHLLGICLFRLPADDDPTTLTLDEVQSALADQNSAPLIDVRIRQESENQWLIEIRNAGIQTAIVDSLTIDLAIASGNVQQITAGQSIVIETLCSGSAEARPCSQQRANVLRIRPRYVPSGKSVSAVLITKKRLATELPVSFQLQTETGATYSSQNVIKVSSGEP